MKKKDDPLAALHRTCIICGKDFGMCPHYGYPIVVGSHNPGGVKITNAGPAPGGIANGLTPPSQMS